jgi:hypothetical protein
MPEAIINVNTSGDNTIVAAVSGKAYLVRQVFLVPAADVSLIFKSGATLLTGAMAFVGNTVWTLPYTPAGWFVTNSNNALVLNLSGNVQVGGRVIYDILDV